MSSKPTAPLSSMIERIAKGDLSAVQDMLDCSVPKAWFNEALVKASMNGHAEIVSRLLPHADAKDKNSYALTLAALNGHADVVAILIPVSDPMADESNALAKAVWCNKLEAVRLLLPVSDQTARKSFVLRNSAYHGFAEIVELLLPGEPDPAAILQAYHQDFPPPICAIIQAHIDTRALQASQSTHDQPTTSRPPRPL